MGKNKEINDKPNSNTQDGAQHKRPRAEYRDNENWGDGSAGVLLPSKYEDLGLPPAPV